MKIEHTPIKSTREILIELRYNIFIEIIKVDRKLKDLNKIIKQNQYTMSRSGFFYNHILDEDFDLMLDI